ncbi:MAG: DNA-directed RNA polymerase subunit omega [Clostridia bacterium]|nr:DNA-directed RNA polymerase subunit omega [Clostridia bacterium]
MLYPAVPELASKTNSRYALVIAVAKRAREIVEQNERKLENADNLMKLDVNEKYFIEKPVKLAINEFSENKFSVKE